MKNSIMIDDNENNGSHDFNKSVEQSKPLNNIPDNKNINLHKKGYEFVTSMSKKYLLTIDSRMNMGGFISENKVEIRWRLTLKKTYEDWYIFELLTLDHTMVKADNSGFIEMHKLVAQMQKALNEIIFSIDKKGKLLHVDNLDEIKRRWAGVKTEILEYNKEMTSLKDVFDIQDQVFESKLGVEGMVRSMEFFDVYLNGLYGKKFPFSTHIERPNLFRSIEIPFSLSYYDRKINSVAFEITVSGKASGLSAEQLKKGYGSFPFIQLQTLKPQYSYDAKYIMQADSGFLHSGEVHYIENVSDKLGGEVHFKIDSYE